MRHYVADPDNPERLIRIPESKVGEIRSEAIRHGFAIGVESCIEEVTRMEGHQPESLEAMRALLKGLRP